MELSKTDSSIFIFSEKNRLSVPKLVKILIRIAFYNKLVYNKGCGSPLVLPPIPARSFTKKVK